MPYRIIDTSSAATSDWTLPLDRQIWTAWSGNHWTTSTSATNSVLVVPSISTPTSAMSDAIWSSWNNVAVKAIRLTTRHIMRTEQERAADREAIIQIEGERAKAREKAEAILRECLSPKQREELALHGHFHLETIAQSGERRRYRIERGRSRNVKQVTPDGRIIKTLCMHPVMDVPDADTMLAQKLYLEGAEDEFLSIANHS